MADELVNINVLVADRHYPLKIRKSEEASVHKAVALVNDKIKEYQRIYEGKDKQDYLSMVLMLFAVEHINNQSKIIIEDSSFEQKLTQLELLLSSAS